MHTFSSRWLRLFLLGLLISLTLSCSAAPGETDVDRHLVFAHNMVCFFNTVEFYKQEIELAQRHGIDGFVLNCGAWLQPDNNGVMQKSNYVIAAENMYEAARQLNSGFKLFMSPDLSGLNPVEANVRDMVTRFYQHPNQFRYHGKAVISGYGGTADTYASAINGLRADGYNICFVPVLSTAGYHMAWNMESLYNFFNNQPHMDGIFYFACDGLVGDLLRQNATGRRATLMLNKIYMAGIAPNYNSANLRDMHGMAGYGALWEGIIRDDADWVEIVTWSDYQEDSNLMPFRWPAGAEKYQFNRDESYLDVTAYYSAWYKTGHRPAITQDKIFFASRNRSKNLVKAWDGGLKKWVEITTISGYFDQIHDDVLDNIYATAFLTAPAELTITLGTEKKSFSMPAGVTSVRIPLVPGVPHFTLLRNKQVLTAVVGRRQIIGKETPTNSLLGAPHLLNRIWAGGAASGPTLRYEAEAATLHPQTSLVKIGKTQTVATTEQDGSGITIPMQGLSTATYNIRIIYCNAGVDDARLTLIANGSTRGDADNGYLIPVFLPPTGKDKFATASFFWSLYDKTSFLKLQWMLGRESGQLIPANNDIGSVLIDAIELVKVNPPSFNVPAQSPIPELVRIPGGSFTMGSKIGAPDEQPLHQVTLSPFAIGKYEVTNAQYELFEPTHYRTRDGFSWRNNEPVIYVSWRNGASYCNWLSQQNGLTPVYNEQSWEMNLQANGFRMPTEAEWEYVASGRGEGRVYPWGNAKPDATRGNISNADVFADNAILRSEEAAGVVAVGSYSTGASRDGVMDLAGNVSEWCSDWFNVYTAGTQTNPCSLAPSNYRSIRGGTWGYYGCSQRSADREFNSQVYGGYIYIGLRIVLPEAGYLKLYGKM